MTADQAVELALGHYRAGRLEPAERIVGQVVAARPGNAVAHNLHGAVLLARGNGPGAVKAFQKAVRLDEANPQYHSNLGEAERQRGKLREAGIALARAVELDPRSAQAHNNLGIVHYDRKAYAEAEQCYRKALAIDPRYPEAANNLGNALRMLGRRDAAVEAYQQALLAREQYPEAYNNLATVLREMRQSEGAEHAYRKAIELRPRYMEAYDNLAQMLAAEKRIEDALRILGRALEIDPRNVRILLTAARVQVQKGSYGQAEQACRAALAIDPASAAAYATLGEIFLDNDRFQDAVAAFEASLARDPSSWETRNLYANCLKAVGRLDEALAAFEQTLAENPEAYGCYANMADLVEFTPENRHFREMQAIVAAAPEMSEDRAAALNFAIGKAYDDVGAYEQALDHWQRGAAVRRRQLDYDEAETFRFFDGIMASYGADFLEKPPFAGNPSQVPVFIVGMPRSGSTLVEQIIASHPRAHGGGETKELSRRLGMVRGRFPGLPRYPELGLRMTADQYRIVADGYLGALQAMDPAAERITDKLLTNYYFVGMLHVLFPNAKFIHTERNPIDACLSAYSKLFKDDLPHSYDFGELGRYHLRYQALMAHWRSILPEGVMMSVAYEDVVADVAGQAKRIIDFVGLPWDPACLAFHESARPVKTASVVQVRKPVYATSVERWRRYGPALQPLIDALCGPEATGPKPAN
jgi:tetratricopeptide (TPR) repeat protein